MKRKFASAILVIGLLAPSMAPANAIFGLSKCEKIKKQILAFEKQEKPIIDKWNLKAGDPTHLWSPNKRAIFQIQWIELVNLEVKMYALEMNNLNCFSSTQRIYIKDTYPYWKEQQQINKWYPRNNNGLTSNGTYKTISWDSIYNQ